MPQTPDESWLLMLRREWLLVESSWRRWCRVAHKLQVLLGAVAPLGHRKVFCYVTILSGRKRPVGTHVDCGESLSRCGQPGPPCVPCFGVRSVHPCVARTLVREKGWRSGLSMFRPVTLDGAEVRTPGRLELTVSCPEKTKNRSDFGALLADCCVQNEHRRV